jgi:phenylacetate-coenzyme A ligase PaaK-like adenylate-forming protein
LTGPVAEKCPGESFMSVYERMPGRPDDTLVFGPGNIYPGRIGRIFSDINEAGSKCRIILTAGEDGRDNPVFKVECASDALARDDRDIKKAIEREVKKQFEAEAVDHTALPGLEIKTKRFWTTEMISGGQGTAFRGRRPGAHARP